MVYLQTIAPIQYNFFQEGSLQFIENQVSYLFVHDDDKIIFEMFNLGISLTYSSTFDIICDFCSSIEFNQATHAIFYKSAKKYHTFFYGTIQG